MRLIFWFSPPHIVMPNPSSPDIALYWTEALGKELLQFLTKRLKCPDTASELTHETYIRLSQASQTNAPDNARALAFRIAVNLAIDYQRKTTFRNHYNADIDLEVLADTIADPAAGPERLLMGQQRFEILHKALAELPPPCRTAFMLRGMEGLSYPEIAARMGISVAMVGKHLARAMAHCAGQLQQQP